MSFHEVESNMIKKTNLRHAKKDVASEDDLLAWWNHIPAGRKIKEYFDASTLHGLKYFSEIDRPLVERYYWMIVLLAVYICAILAVYDQIELFRKTPVLMSLDSHATPVWDIPFPAVTICSENQVRPSFFNYSAFMGRTNLTKTEEEILTYIRFTCRFNLTTKEGDLDFFNAKVLEVIHNDIWKHCSNTYSSVTWLSQTVFSPCKILQPVLTPMGACHTFNGLPGDRMYRSDIYSSLHAHHHHLKSSDEGVVWSPDGGYKDRQPFATPPWRTSGGGLGQNALFLLNLSAKDFDSQCFFGGRGFMVFLHSPAELPTTSHPSAYISADEESTIKVIPELKITESQLRRWNPAERGCFFQDERPLQYFQYYTERNCDLECESNMSLSLCSCVPFFLPRTRNIPICGPEKMQCYIHSISKSLDLELDMDDECDCRPSCFEIDYSLNVVRAYRNYSIASLKGYFNNDSNLIPEDNFAIFSVQYQTQKVIAMERIAVFRLSDFIANIGGLLGLFLGFSFLSLFEIFYFCILRFRKKRSMKIRSSNDSCNNFDM